MRFSKWLLLFTFLLTSTILFAQDSKQITKQELFWLRYYAHLQFSENWKLRTELEERMYINPWRQHQILFRNNLERKLGKGMKVAIGFTWFEQTLPHDPSDEDVYTRIELRPQQEIAFKQQFSDRFYLSHRYWFEERFFQKLDNRVPVGGYEFRVLRIRYKLQGNFDIIPAEGLKGKLTLSVHDEVMINVGGKIVQNTFDQNRLGVALSYGLTDNFALEGSFFNWFQQRSSGVDYFNRNIWRLTVKHHMRLRKK